MTTTELSKFNSRAPLDRSPKKNWVENSGGLPMYIRRIANHVHAKGKSIGHSIAIAVNAVKKMCATGDVNWPGVQQVNAGSRAEACAAVADWERKKAQARVSKGELGRKWSDTEYIEYVTGEVISERVVKRYIEEQEEIAKQGFKPGQKRGDDGTWVRTNGAGDKNRKYKKNKKGRKTKGSKKKYPNPTFEPPAGAVSGAFHRIKGSGIKHKRRSTKVGVFKMKDGSYAVFVRDWQRTKKAKSFKSKAEAKAYADKIDDKRKSALSSAHISLANTKHVGEKKKSNRRKNNLERYHESIKGNKGEKVKANLSGSSRRKKTTTPAKKKKSSNKTTKLVYSNQAKNNQKRIFSKSSKEFPKSDWSDAKEGQKCSRWSCENPAVASRKTKNGKMGACKKHKKEMTKGVSKSKINADKVSFDMTGKIEKKDKDQQLVFGWCSVAKRADGSTVVDKQGDVLEDIDAMENVAYDFVLNSRDGGEMHVRKGVSTLVESFVSTPEKCRDMGIPEGTLPVGWWVGFKVNDPEVWDGIKKKKYTSFSVHGSGTRKNYEGDAE